MAVLAASDLAAYIDPENSLAGEDTLLTMIIDGMQSIAEAELGQPFDEETVQGEKHNGGRNTVWLEKWRAIQSVTEVRVDSWVLEADAWDYEPTTGEVFMKPDTATFSAGRRNVEVDYVTGYASGELPEKYRLAFLVWGATLWAMRDKWHLQSVGDAERNVSYAREYMPPMAKELFLRIGGVAG